MESTVVWSDVDSQRWSVRLRETNTECEQVKVVGIDEDRHG